MRSFPPWGKAMQFNVIFFLINGAGALIVIGVSLPLAMRKVKMNDFYGIRIKKSFESKDNWYAINEYGGKQLILWSIPMLVAGVLSMFLTVDDQHRTLMAVLLGGGPVTSCMTIAVWKIVSYSRKL